MQKFKLKLNRDKLAGLLDFTGYLLEKHPPMDKAEKLIDVLIRRIYIKMRNRLEQGNSRTGYQITLTPDEALAFELWLTNVAKPQCIYLYEANLTRQICNDIDKIYG